MIRVASDHEGVRIAVGELLREPMVQFANDRLRANAEGAGNADRILADLKPVRTLSDGYYVRGQYLLYLHNRLKFVSFAAKDLAAEDVDGLIEVNSAIVEFEQSHWQCPQCAMWNERGALGCQRCNFDPHNREA